MKTLQIIRHAKSSWANPELTDKSRPLNKRGYRSCELMASRLISAGCDFNFVFCSTAVRARETISNLVKALPEEGIHGREIICQLDEALYTFDDEALLAWCQRLDNDLSNVLLVGHNPALTELCNSLAGAAIENIPTCGYARIELPIDNWGELGSGTGYLVEYLTPKMFR